VSESLDTLGWYNVDSRKRSHLILKIFLKNQKRSHVKGACGDNCIIEISNGQFQETISKSVGPGRALHSSGIRDQNWTANRIRLAIAKEKENKN
jgi:hypothetical protein